MTKKTLSDLDREWLQITGRDPKTLKMAEQIYNLLATYNAAHTDGLRASDVLAALVVKLSTPHYNLSKISDRLWADLVLKCLPNLERVHAELVKRGHNSEDNSFDFNDMDDHIWVESAPKDQRVIIHEMQSVNWFYVWDAKLVTDVVPHFGTFHVRQWWPLYVPAKDIKDEFDKKWAREEEVAFKKGGILYAIKKADRLAEVWSDGVSTEHWYSRRPSLEEYREAKFKPRYGDFRDPGYVLSYQAFRNEVEGSMRVRSELEVMCTCLIPCMICELFGEEKKEVEEMMSNVDEIRRADGLLPRYASVGGYPLFYVCKDGGVLCADCANGKNDSDASTTTDDSRWLLVGYDCNWEDRNLYCSHCNAHIESAYAEDEPQCPQCGEEHCLSVIVEKQKFPTPHADLSVEIPVHCCSNCGYQWTSEAAEKIRTIALFRWEKSQGIKRVRFYSADEEEWYRQVEGEQS